MTYKELTQEAKSQINYLLSKAESKSNESQQESNQDWAYGVFLLWNSVARKNKNYQTDRDYFDKKLGLKEDNRLN